MRIILLALAVSALPAVARAQTPSPAPTFEFHPENAAEATAPAPPAPKPPEKPTVWKANMQLGLTWVNGNAESFGLSGTALGGVKHYHNAFEILAQGAYALAAIEKYKGGPLGPSNAAAENWLLRGRYDRFLTARNTVFASFTGSGDLIAGYVYRLEPQVGYQRIFFKSDHQVVTGELGYDYTRDHYVAGSVPRDADYHSVRVFAGYENKFTAYASFLEGIEVLWALNQTDHVRINSLTSLSSTVAKNVSLKLNFTLKANTDPPLRPVDPMDPLADPGHYKQVDSTLEAVLAVTFI